MCDYMCIIDVVLPIGSMYAIYGNIYHQYTPNVSIYTIHGSYGLSRLETAVSRKNTGCLTSNGIPSFEKPWILDGFQSWNVLEKHIRMCCVTQIDLAFRSISPLKHLKS